MEPGKYYHLYTHANGSENLFREEENYRYFLQRFSSFVPPVAHTLAYCLMPNHLHLLVQIKNEKALVEALKEIKKTKNVTTDLTGLGFENLPGLTVLQFSHLFNAYSKAYNKMYKRMGSLFTRSFHRKKIQSDQQLTTVIRYIHHNPVRHGFARHPGEWPWSSYTTLLSGNRPDWLSSDWLIQCFGNLYEFKKAHELPPENLESPFQ
jgi:putative transposase